MTEINGVAVVEPTSYEDVGPLAEAFLEQRPVLVDLRERDLLLARRVIDFCSGLTYGQRGTAETVFERVVLLTPQGETIDKQLRQRLSAYLTGDMDQPDAGPDVVQRIAGFCKERHNILIGPITAEKIAEEVLGQPGVKFEVIGADPRRGNPKKVLISCDELQRYLEEDPE